MNPLRKYGMNIFSIVICLGGLFGNFLTNYLGSFETLILVIFSFYLLGFLFVAGLLPESPSYLLKRGLARDLEAVILGMARTNRLDTDQVGRAVSDTYSVLRCIYLFTLRNLKTSRVKRIKSMGTRHLRTPHF